MPDPIPTNTAPQTTLDVPEIESAAAPANVTVVDIPAPKGLDGIQGPKEALGEDPKAEMEAMEEQMKTGKLANRPRDEKGRLIPTAKDKESIMQPAKVAKPAAKPVEAVAKPVPAAKIKIGDAEMTPEEIAAKIADLEAKAKPADKQPDPKDDPKPEEVEAQAKERLSAARKGFVAESASKLVPTEQELDIILSGGKAAVEMWGKKMEQYAELIADTREHLTAQINQQLRERDEWLKPVLDREGQISTYQKEAQFLDTNKDIKDHPEGISTYRKVATDFHNGYDQIQQKIAQGTATPQERAWAIQYEGLTPEAFEASVAAQTRNALKMPVGLPPGSKPPEVPAKPVPAKPAAPQAKPFNGDRPGNAARPASESADARALREMNEREGISH